MSNITGITRGGASWTPAFVTNLNQVRCIGCGRCYKVCGREVMTLKGLDDEGGVIDLDGDDDDEIEKKIMVMHDEGACIGCGACAEVCPTGGIDLEGIPVTLRNWRWHKPGVGHA